MNLKQNNEPGYDDQRKCIVAIKNNDLNSLVQFVNEFGVDAPVDKGTALHQCVFNNNIIFANYLLDNSANPDALNGNGITPLIVSIDLNYWKMAKLLIEKGADVNLKDGKNNSPLSKAIFHYNGNKDLIELILSKGAKPYMKLIEDFTAVDLARKMDLGDVLSILAKHDNKQ